MPIVRVEKEILRRLAPYDGLSKALKDFIRCQQEGRTPSRIYKPSGAANDGTIFQPYARLVLWHHHLHRRGDPLLITQHIAGAIIVFALTRHAEYFGDKMLWLQQHQSAIDWSGCEDIRAEVVAYAPPQP